METHPGTTHPTNWVAARGLAKAYEGNYDVDTAISGWNGILEKDPTSCTIAGWPAEAYERKGDIDVPISGMRA